ncbi:energy transducer TonB [Spirosoma litoris]
MKIIFFLLFFSSAIAQQTVYQSFEVDSVAAPRGGNLLLNTFLQTNLRKPIAAAAKGVGGRVILSAIVELDGSVSDVKIVNSLRPDCDREAMRVFRLFKAWQPGIKGGKAVRQQITTTVLFKPNPPFIYNNGAQVSYYDSDKKALADSSDKVRYKQEAPLDSNGLANGDIVVYKGKGGNWKEEYRIPFVRQVNESQGASDQSTTTIGYQGDGHRWDGEVILLTKSGSIIYKYFYKNGAPTSEGVHYSSNGLVSEKREEFDGGFIATSWYDNGQIREIKVNNYLSLTDKSFMSSVKAFWTPTGQQLVKNGNGRVNHKQQVRSYSSLLPKTVVIEEGAYENGLQQGIWIGQYEDKSFYYEELFDKGVFQKGKSCLLGGDTITYTVLEKVPEFKGGMQALGNFLAQNLHYPPEAQQSKIEGQVFLSFIIDADGRVIDIDLVKGLGHGTNEEAIRVLKATSGRWIPGHQRGQKINVKYNLPINFSLH